MIYLVTAGVTTVKICMISPLLRISCLRIVLRHCYFAKHSPMPKPLPPPYLVRRTRADFEVTGQGTSPNWQSAKDLTDFSFPWENDIPGRTSFKAIHGERWVYFLFDADD